jgi:CRP-like cAMP-binding protein
LKGFIKVFHTSESGTDKIFAIIAAGDLLGEMAMFETNRRSASACAIERTETLLLPQKSLGGLIAAVPALSLRITEIITKRLRRINLQVVLAEADSRTKILSQLLSLAQDCGQPDPPGGCLTIPFRLTHSDLAAYSGLARETVTKRLSELAKEKMIAIGKRRRLQLDVGAIKKELNLS